MKQRLRVEGIIDTLAHAKTVKQSVVAELAGKDIFEEHDLDHEVDEEGQVWFRLDIRFNGAVDRGAVRDWIKGQIEDHPQAKTWFLGARIVTHQCVHDGSYDLDTGDSDNPTVRPEKCSQAERVVVLAKGLLKHPDPPEEPEPDPLVHPEPHLDP